MTASRKFPQVDHADAAGGLKEIYEDIQGTLRVAWVAFACRVLAAFPAYLPLAWRAARPNFATRYAERAADELRALALLPGPAPRTLGPNFGGSAGTRRASTRCAARSTSSTTATRSTCPGLTLRRGSASAAPTAARAGRGPAP